MCTFMVVSKTDGFIQDKVWSLRTGITDCKKLKYHKKSIKQFTLTAEIIRTSNGSKSEQTRHGLQICDMKTALKITSQFWSGTDMFRLRNLSIYSVSEIEIIVLFYKPRQRYFLESLKWKIISFEISYNNRNFCNLKMIDASDQIKMW